MSGETNNTINGKKGDTNASLTQILSSYLTENTVCLN